jgi:hypothetical protein
MKRNRSQLASLSLVALVASCGSSEPPAGLGLPLAIVACPAEVALGDTFTVDGSASSDDGTLTASLIVGAERADALTGTFTAANPGVTTAVLTVTDEMGQTATAKCRVIVVGEAPATGAPDVPGDAPGDEPDDPAPPEDVNLTGAFAFVANDRPRLVGNSIGDTPQCAPAPQIALVNMEHVGDDVTMSLKWCDLQGADVIATFVGEQDMVVPAETTALLPSIGPFTFALAGSSFAPPLEQIARPLVLGATLADPLNDPLPHTTEATNLTDEDGDGTDGVPVFVNGVQFNVIYRRILFALSGTVFSSNEIDGSAEGSYRASGEVGLLNEFLQSQVPNAEALPSTFKMLRVDGANANAIDFRGADGVVTCADLVERVTELQGLPAALPAPEGCTVIGP